MKKLSDVLARYDLETEEILEVFNTYGDVKAAGYDMGAVCNVTKGRRKSHKGYGWLLLSKKEAPDYT